MSALAVIAPARPGTHTEPAHCNCGRRSTPRTSDTPYERRNHTCFECEQTDQAVACAVCEEHVAVAYCDGRPTFCSTSCEEAYWACLDIDL